MQGRRETMRTNYHTSVPRLGKVFSHLTSRHSLFVGSSKRNGVSADTSVSTTAGILTVLDRNRDVPLDLAPPLFFLSFFSKLNGRNSFFGVCLISNDLFQSVKQG